MRPRATATLVRVHVQHSVLIAAYNAAAFLPKALASVRAQTDAGWELVVVEDGSRDATEDIVKKFAATVPQSVRYENAGVNRGIAATRTRLLALAHGELCSFLDADDWWEPRHLAAARLAAGAYAPAEAGWAEGRGGTEGQRSAGGQGSLADVVVSNISIHDIGRGIALGAYSPPGELAASPARTLFRKSVIMTSSSVTLRRTLAARAGEFDETLRIGEDRDYWLRCALAGARFALTRETTCTYSKHAASTMTRTLLWAACDVAFFEKYRECGAFSPALRRRMLAHALQNQARLLRHDAPAESARLLRRAWKLTPSDFAIAAQWAYSQLLSPRGKSGDGE